MYLCSDKGIWTFIICHGRAFLKHIIDSDNMLWICVVVTWCWYRSWGASRWREAQSRDHWRHYLFKLVGAVEWGIDILVVLLYLDNGHWNLDTHIEGKNEYEWRNDHWEIFCYSDIFFSSDKLRMVVFVIWHRIRPTGPALYAMW